MKKSNLYRLGVCLGIAALSVICVACSIKAGNSDADVTFAAETSVVETEMTEETTAETTKKKAKETKPTEKATVESTEKEPTKPTKSPTKESTSETTAEAAGIYTGPEITPPAERVYPITSEDAIAVFDALGLSNTEMSSGLEYVDEEIAAFDPSYTYRYMYCAFRNKEVADICLGGMQEGFSKDKNGEPIDGTCEITEEDGYSKLVVCGEYKNGDSIYVLAVSVDNVIVSGVTLSTAECDKKVIDYYLIGLGYL